MKRILLVLVCSVLVCNLTTAQEISFKKSYSVESAARFIKMARAAQAGEIPTDEAWKELFATDGYRNFFKGWRDTLKWQMRLKDAFRVVFDERNRGLRDSIVALQVTAEADMDRYIIKNFNILRSRLDEVGVFLHNSDFGQIFEKAHLRAKEFLPAEFERLKPVFNDFYFVAFDPEARVAGNKVYMDINNFYEEGEEGMVNLIAHELHHSYWGEMMGARYRETDDPLFTTLCRLQMEGLADQINKPQMPVKELGLYGQDVIDLYNADYFATPELLRRMDGIVTAYAAGEITEAEYAKIAGLVHFGGHTGGDYMVFLIRDQLGKEAVLETVADLGEFLWKYNQAARKAGGKNHVFSPGFIRFAGEVLARTEKG